MKPSGSEHDRDKQGQIGGAGPTRSDVCAVLCCAEGCMRKSGGWFATTSSCPAVQEDQSVVVAGNEVDPVTVPVCVLVAR